MDKDRNMFCLEWINQLNKDWRIGNKIKLVSCISVRGFYNNLSWNRVWCFCWTKYAPWILMFVRIIEEFFLVNIVYISWIACYRREPVPLVAAFACLIALPRRRHHIFFKWWPDNLRPLLAERWSVCEEKALDDCHILERLKEFFGWTLPLAFLRMKINFVCKFEIYQCNRARLIAYRLLCIFIDEIYACRYLKN